MLLLLKPNLLYGVKIVNTNTTMEIKLYVKACIGAMALILNRLRKTSVQEEKGEKMNESKYSVAIDGTMVAQGMNLETALILVKGLFETYYAEPKISVCIEVER